MLDIWRPVQTWLVAPAAQLSLLKQSVRGSVTRKLRKGCLVLKLRRHGGPLWVKTHQSADDLSTADLPQQMDAPIIRGGTGQRCQERAVPERRGAVLVRGRDNDAELCTRPQVFGTSPRTHQALAVSVNAPSWRSPSNRLRMRASSSCRRSCDRDTTNAPPGPAPFVNGSQ